MIHRLHAINCFQGLAQGCLAGLVLFSILINELAYDIMAKGRHGATLTRDEIELFLLLFADDLTLLFLDYKPK